MALKELFIEVLLPKRKLNTFIDFVKQNQGNGKLRDDQLSDAYVEHRVKELYRAYLNILEGGLKDELQFYKDSVTVVLGDLLKAKPE